MAHAIHLLRSCPLHLKVHWRKGNGPEMFLSNKLSRIKYPYLPGSLLKREAQRIIARGRYKEDLSTFQVPPNVVGQEFSMGELPILIQMYQDGFFTKQKKDKDFALGDIVDKYLSPSEVQLFKEKQTQVGVPAHTPAVSLANCQLECDPLPHTHISEEQVPFAPTRRYISQKGKGQSARYVRISLTVWFLRPTKQKRDLLSLHPLSTSAPLKSGKYLLQLLPTEKSKRTRKCLLH